MGGDKQIGATTVELMREAFDDEDREVIAVVGLLDVNEAAPVTDLARSD
jgi:succinyl-CoA synthetase alpha subunit